MKKMALNVFVLCATTLSMLALVACGGDATTSVPETPGHQTAQERFDALRANESDNQPEAASDETPDETSEVTAGLVDLNDKSNYYFILGDNRFYLWETTVGDFNSLEVINLGMPANSVTELEAGTGIDHLHIVTEYGTFRIGAHNPYDWTVPIEEAIVDRVAASARTDHEIRGHLNAEITFAGGLTPGVSTREEIEVQLGALQGTVWRHAYAFSACGSIRVPDLDRSNGGRGFIVSLMDDEDIPWQITMVFYPEVE